VPNVTGISDSWVISSTGLQISSTFGWIVHPRSVFLSAWWEDKYLEFLPTLLYQCERHSREPVI